MRRTWIGVAAVSALAAATAGALAQQGGPDGPFRRGWGGGPSSVSPADREAFTDARIAALRAGLKLTPDQDKLWPAVEDALRGLARQRAEARTQRRERWASMRDSEAVDIPGQLRFMADRQAASADALRKLADASSPLYASLDEAQKRRLQVLGRMMRPGMGRHGGPGWREGPMRRGDLGGGPHDFAEGAPGPR